MANQIGNSVNMDYVDKRKAMTTAAQPDIKTTRGTTLHTATGSGSTTTLVGATGVLTTSVGIFRLGEKFRLFTAAGALKEEKIFVVTANNGTGTLTFTPAAAVATASGDVARLVDDSSYQDEANLDTRLLALGFTASQISCMNQNDKVFAIRLRDDPGSMS